MPARRAAPARRALAAPVTATSVGVALVVLQWSIVGQPSAWMFVVAVSMGLAVYISIDRRSLEGQLRSARVRSIDARDLERRRIQRDLHDGAQQRLVSVRIHLGLLAQSVESPERATLEHLGQDLDTALREIRTVTDDGSPYQLGAMGPAASLRSIANSAPIPVSIEVDGFGRYPEQIERSLYFCCVEALQNVVKHAGPRAKARIRLAAADGMVAFEVADSGVGFDPVRVNPGQGLVNLADRVASVNGHLDVDSRPGEGTRIRGQIPLR